MIDYVDFRRFFEENYKKFYSFAYQFVGDRETCRDIVGDAFENAWRNRKRPEISDLNNYLYSFIHNNCVNYLRHEKVKQKHAEFYRQMYRDSKTDQTVDVDERIRRMNIIINSMTEQTRTVFRMCYIDKMKYKEVADALGVTTSTVQKHIVRALKMLRDGLRNVD